MRALLLIVFCSVCAASTFVWASTLVWDANEDGVTVGYRVYSGTASRSYSNAVDVGCATNFALTAFERGVWFFAVTAYSADGLESDFSDEVSWTNAPAVVTVAVQQSSNLVDWSTVIEMPAVDVTGAQYWRFQIH